MSLLRMTMFPSTATRTGSGACRVGVMSAGAPWPPARHIKQPYHERGPDFGCLDEFPLKSAQFQRLCGKRAAREPLGVARSDLMTLRCDHKSSG